MKKLIMQALVAVTSVSMLAGCGTATSAANADTGDVTTTDAASATGAPSENEGTVVAVIEENVEPHTGASTDEYDESTVVDISLGPDISATSDAVVVDGTTVTITSAGAYKVSGTLDDGEIIVDAADDAAVQIILDGTDITNTDGAAIAIMNADTATVTLAEGSANTLTDGDVYVFAEGEDEPNAALFSTADLTLGGTGSLTVFGNYNDGIASKDGMVIVGGDIVVDAVDDGIRGKDYVVIEGGNLEITAGGDGVKSDEDEDPERGYIRIADGQIAVTSSDDGVQATTDVVITGGTLDVVAGGATASDSPRGIQGDEMVAISGGSITVSSADDAVHSNSTVNIDGGDLTLAAGDDGIHGDLFVTINGGSILITESFEGIESEVITINDGNIDITSSDDGINVATAEAATTEDPAVTPEPATDEAAVQPPVDGATGRPARGGGGGRGAGAGAGAADPDAVGVPDDGAGPGAGAGPDDGIGEHYVYINGGTIAITVTGDLAEQGDGIDANGHIEMTGGVVAVSGPTDTRNSALDYSGGSFTMTGGMFIGTNINGRNSEGIGDGSSQASLYVALDSVVEAGTLLHIQSTSGEGHVTFEAANDFDLVVFSSPELTVGETYEIYVGGTGSGGSSTGLYESYTPGVLAGTGTAA